MERRNFIRAAAAVAASALTSIESRVHPTPSGPGSSQTDAASGIAQTPPSSVTRARHPLLKPRRLSAGDTVALVAPASATFNTVDLDIARESLEALGLKVQVGGHLLDRHGYLAGQDRDRADDINRFFGDPSIRAVLPIRG